MRDMISVYEMIVVKLQQKRLCGRQRLSWEDIKLLLLLSVGLPVVNAPDVLQPCGLLYYP